MALRRILVSISGLREKLSAYEMKSCRFGFLNMGPQFFDGELNLVSSECIKRSRKSVTQAPLPRSGMTVNAPSRFTHQGLVAPFPATLFGGSGRVCICCPSGCFRSNISKVAAVCLVDRRNRSFCEIPFLYRRVRSLLYCCVRRCPFHSNLNIPCKASK